MTIIEMIGAFLSGIILISALSLILAPGSEASGVIKSLGSSTADILGAAKSRPA
jgi:hypothetical protein